MCPTTIFLFKKTILTALQSKVEAPGYISSCNFLLLHDHTKNMCMCVCISKYEEISRRLVALA